MGDARHTWIEVARFGPARRWRRPLARGIVSCSVSTVAATNTKCRHRNHDAIRQPQRGHLPVMSGILWTRARLETGRTLPLGSWSLASLVWPRTWRCDATRGGLPQGGHPREADWSAAPQVVRRIVAASRRSVCRVMPPFVALGVPLLSVGGLHLVKMRAGWRRHPPSPGTRKEAALPSPCSRGGAAMRLVKRQWYNAEMRSPLPRGRTAVEVRSHNPLTAPPGVPAPRHEAHNLRLNGALTGRRERIN